MLAAWFAFDITRCSSMGYPASHEPQISIPFMPIVPIDVADRVMMIKTLYSAITGSSNVSQVEITSF